jgi:hypothetical protein
MNAGMTETWLETWGERARGVGRAGSRSRESGLKAQGEWAQGTERVGSGYGESGLV